MLYVKSLSIEEKQTLEAMYKNHPRHAPRKRAYAILLSNDGFNIKELSGFFGISRQTAATWLHSWEEDGICGLMDNARSGRPSKLSAEHKQEAIELVKESPRSLRKVVAELVEKFAVKISCSTLKRYCKQVKLRWKRVRCSLKSKRNPALFAVAKQQLIELKQQAKQEIIDLVYFDQSGFTLEPCIPYAWQPVNQTIEIPCSKSKRLNVLGFMSSTCAFESMVFEGTITSAVVVSCIDSFAQSIQRPTTLVLDNAPIHTSNEFTDNIEKWQKMGLTLFYIPPYSPELNLIEILWRKIKYEWMPFSAYLSFQSLKDCLFDILATIGFGSTYSITFS